MCFLTKRDKKIFHEYSEYSCNDDERAREELKLVATGFSF